MCDTRRAQINPDEFVTSTHYNELARRNHDSYDQNRNWDSDGTDAIGTHDGTNSCLRWGGERKVASGARCSVALHWSGHSNIFPNAGSAAAVSERSGSHL